MTPIDEAINALREIVSKKGKTMLHDCCVHKTCHEVPGESPCAFQLGVNHGFEECAGIAECALMEIERKQSGEK